MKKITLLLILTLAATLALPTFASDIEKNVSFELDRWYDIEVTEGPVTIHRVRLEKQSGVTKSSFFRPGNNEYLQTVQIQIEYSNDSSKDWEAELDIHWKDANGEIIDGYQDEEGLDEGDRHDITTVTLSTLKYGLKKAKKLHIEMSLHPD